MNERVRPKELAKILGTSPNNICDFAKRHTGKGSVNPTHPNHSGSQNYYEYKHAFLIYLLYRLMKLGLGDKGVTQAVCKWFMSYPWPLAKFQELIELEKNVWLAVPVSSYSRDFNEHLRVMREPNG